MCDEGDQKKNYMYKHHAKKDMEVKDDLPSPIVEEILARLPVKSIIRFRCVCKEWSSSLVSVKFHRLRSTLAPPQFRCQKVLEATKSGLCLTHYDQGEFATQTTLYFPLKRSDTSVAFVGSCHGLVCLALDKDKFKDLVLWNPSTGIYRQLPDPEDTCGFFFAAYGFGYDSISHDYKIFFLSLEKHEARSTTQVFSLKANSWKKIGVSLKYFCGGYGLFLNGALHWDNLNKVIAFHLGREEFYNFPLPAPELPQSTSSDAMGIVGDYLCKSYYSPNWVKERFGLCRNMVSKQLGFH